MTLLNEGIREAMARPSLDDRLIITPLLDPDAQIGPGSVDLRLGTEFVEVDRSGQRLVDVFDRSAARQELAREQRTVVPLGSGLALHPGQFILGSTLEFLSIPADISGQVVSRSSWGRLGLIVATAVAVQPGFRGILTLELVNTGSVPILLRPGSRVAHIQLWQASEQTSRPYSLDGKYLVPTGPETARLRGELNEGSRLQRVGRDLYPGGLDDDDAEPRIGAVRDPRTEHIDAVESDAPEKTEDGQTADGTASSSGEEVDAS